MRRVIPDNISTALRICFAGLLAWFAGSAICTGILGGCEAADAAGTTAVSSEAPLVRVLVAAKVQDVRITATLPPVLDGAALGGAVRLALPDRQAVGVSLTPAGWRIGNHLFPRGELTLSPEQDGSLAINGKRYRGSLRFVPGKGAADRFDVVNDLDMEAYLMGVLPAELPPTWHAEAYEAQAVVARTYAIWELKTEGTSRGHFDLYDDDKSQVYGGMDAESGKARDAVRNTRGQVAAHATPSGPRIFKAYFHSTSGGATLGVESAFNEPPSRALSAQSLGESSQASKFHQWPAVVLSKEEITRRMKLWGERRGHPIKKIGRVDRLEIAAKNEFGRPTRFEVIDSRGNRYSLIPEEVRWALNTGAEGTTVYSGYFEPTNNADNIVITNGRGWGHGVGMCQFTAEAWATEGKDHVEIVTASYPGTTVVRAY